MNGSKLFRLCFIFLIIHVFFTSDVNASDYDDDDVDIVKCGKLEFQCEDNGRCIPRSLFCNNKFDCDDKRDESFCNARNLNCPSNWWKCGNTFRCIPGHWRCNGFVDCADNSDEVGCASITTVSPPPKEEAGVSLARKNLIKWFLKQRKNGSTTNKWGHELPRTAISLFLGDKDIFSHGKTTMAEMSYEMSIRLLSDLSRGGDQQLERKYLATYIHALMVTCIDPRNFHGRDLVSELRENVEMSDNNNPFEILVLCNAGDKMTEKDVVRIVSAYSNRSRPFWIDNQAMAALAMTCLYNSSDVEVDERTLIEMTKELKKQQFSNGTVQNLKTTALVVQALIATQSHKINFDLDGAIKSILRHQKSDGSFGSFLESYYILPALSNSTLLDITSKHCKRSSTNGEEAFSEFQRRRGEKISTQISMWIGDDADLKRSWTLKVPLNSTFYEILEIANKLDTRQRIAYNVIDGKPYVSSMIGLEDDIEMGIYWFMYIRTENSGKNPKLVEHSPVEGKIGPNQELILWYKSS